MELDLLTAISPIDGRYRGKTDALAAYFSEFALIKYRVQVEVEYFITLCELPLPQLKGVDKNVFETLRNIYRNFSEADAQRIKDIESVTNHDVKAVEYFLKEEFDKMGGMDDYKEFIHFGLTSQDINNTSVPLSIKEALEQVYYPQIEELIVQLRTYAEEWTAIPMLAKTHGQPASPTRLGKEVMVFVYRLERQLATLKSCPLTAKFGGATGNYNAHHVAYPEFDWKAFGNRFVAEKLGLEREEYTTQISNYDNLSAVFDAMKRINTVMIDMNRDFWQYISMEYFKQKIKAGEVGSSAMPHKMNARSCERVNGFHVILKGFLMMISGLAGDQWNEGDVSCSVVRRVVMPDSFYAADGLFETFLTVLNQMGVYEAVVAAELRRYLPFLMTTTILMEAVKRGIGRETAHEVIKEHAVAVSNDLRAGKIMENNLLDRLAEDGRLGIDRADLQRIFDSNSSATGMADAQVEAFRSMVKEVTDRFPDGAGYQPGDIL